MKKYLLLLGVSTLSLIAPTYTYAEPAETKTEHYEGAKFEPVEDAFKGLNEHTAQIGEILKKDGELEFLELEEIHEISYALEAAIDKIRAEKAVDATKSDTTDEAIQALHFASEKQKETETRAWFVKLQTSVAALSVKAEDAKPVKRAQYDIIIKDHMFSPAEIIVPAGEKIKLRIDNQDPTPEEFESHDMNREKIIGGGKKATIFVGPLKPGKYHFFGEFNMDTANGYIIAK